MNALHRSSADFPIYLRKPMAFSAAVALLFLFICSLYIIWSDRLVARIAGSSEMELYLQTVKGVVFVTLNSLLIFFLCWSLLRRIAHGQQALVDHQLALVASERRAAAGLLAHSIAHDMNNVLTVGMANVEMLRSHTSLDPAASEMLHDVSQSFERLHEMTRRMSRTGQRDAGEKPRPTDLAELVHKEIRFLQRHGAMSDCSILFQGPDHLPYSAFPDSLQELIENLLLNAADATGRRGRIEVRLIEDARGIVLEVHDTGPGVPPERRAQVFEPFFTTKPNGLGLGLLSVKAAVKRHRGQIEISDSPLGGACFRIILPAPAAVATS